MKRTRAGSMAGLLFLAALSATAAPAQPRFSEAQQLRVCERLVRAGRGAEGMAACRPLIWSSHPLVRRAATEGYRRASQRYLTVSIRSDIPLAAAPDLYIARPACPGEGCRWGVWTARRNIGLFRAPGARGLSGRLQRGERVAVLAAEHHVLPVRGQVTAPFNDLRLGETVWLMNPLSEGTSNIWIRGRILNDPRSDCRPQPGCSTALRFPRDAAPGVFWVRVQRRDGEVGWTNTADAFTGTDELSGPEPTPADPLDRGMGE